MERGIGVIGAGIMGKGVAQRFAQYGYQVTLLDVNEQILEKAVEEIRRSLKFACMFQKNLDIEQIMSRIRTTVTYDNLSQVDYIIENVPEVEEIKKNIYMELEKVCKPECIYMVNTSCIPITRVGSFTNRADKIIGVHFMNPVPMKNFSEVIKGWHTSQDTIDEVTELLKSIGISVEVINDSAGFVSNRLSHLFMNEAANLVYEGVATAEQIDNIFKNAFGHKMGPLETADLIGIDTVVDSLKILYDEYQDSKFRVSPLMKKMVDANMLGRKNGKGFYNYK